MNQGIRFVAVTVLLACDSGPDDRRASAENPLGGPVPADSLVLTNAVGVQVWFTLARQGMASDGSSCIERGLEIRRGGTRVKVPLLYTGTPPVLLNDSIMRASLWTHCLAGAAYLINLRNGHPVRERAANPS